MPFSLVDGHQGFCLFLPSVWMHQVPPKHTRKTDIHCPENFKSHTEHFHFPLYVYFQTVAYHIGYHEVHQRLMHRHSGGTMTATHGLMPSKVNGMANTAVWYLDSVTLALVCRKEKLT